MLMKFIGGPRHGEAEEYNDPAEMIVPKGSNFELMMAFLEGKQLLIPCYRKAIYKGKLVYYWTEPEKQ